MFYNLHFNTYSAGHFSHLLGGVMTPPYIQSITLPFLISIVLPSLVNRPGSQQVMKT